MCQCASHTYTSHPMWGGAVVLVRAGVVVEVGWRPLWSPWLGVCMCGFALTLVVALAGGLHVWVCMLAMVVALAGGLHVWVCVDPCGRPGWGSACVGLHACHGGRPGWGSACVGLHACHGGCTPTEGRPQGSPPRRRSSPAPTMTPRPRGAARGHGGCGDGTLVVALGRGPHTLALANCIREGARIPASWSLPPLPLQDLVLYKYPAILYY